MRTNVKELFVEIARVFNYQNIKYFFKKSILDNQSYLKQLIYKINHLFSTNLENGLMNYYTGYYNDSLARFYIMNIIWKSNSTVQYNLGRINFIKKKNEKAIYYFNQALALNKRSNVDNRNFNNELAQYFLLKINNCENVTYVPKYLNQEYYDYSINSIINESLDHIGQFKEIFDLYNHYIWLYIKEKHTNPNEFHHKIRVLELGSQNGIYGELIRNEYRNIYLKGVDLSAKMCDFCQGLTSIKDENVYNKLANAEMHEYLHHNFKNKDKFFDIILSMGTFGDFGQLKTVIELSINNLYLNGLLIFYVKKSSENIIQFSQYGDYFLYDVDYIKDIALKLKLEIIMMNGNQENQQEEKILVILKKVENDIGDSKIDE